MLFVQESPNFERIIDTAITVLILAVLVIKKIAEKKKHWEEVAAVSVQDPCFGRWLWVTIEVYS